MDQTIIPLSKTNLQTFSRFKLVNSTYQEVNGVKSIFKTYAEFYCQQAKEQ